MIIDKIFSFILISLLFNNGLCEDKHIPSNFERQWRLGQAFNYPDDRIIFRSAIGLNAGYNSLESLYINKRVDSLDYDFKQVDSVGSSLGILDLNAELAMSAMSGNLAGGIKGAYSRINKNYHETSEIVVKLKFISKVQGLDMRGVKRIDTARELVDDHGATHFVKELTYGGELLASLSFDKNEDLERTVLDASAALKYASEPFTLLAEGQIKMDDSLTKNAQNLKIKIWGLPAPLGTPQSKSEFEAYLTDFVEFVKEFNGGFGVPIQVTLGDIRDVLPQGEADALMNLPAKEMMVDTMEYINDIQITIQKFPEISPKIDRYQILTGETSAMELASFIIDKSNDVLLTIFTSVTNMEMGQGQTPDLSGATRAYNGVGYDYPCIPGTGRYYRQLDFINSHIDKCGMDLAGTGESRASSYCTGHGTCLVFADPTRRDADGNSCLQSDISCRCEYGFTGVKCDIHVCELNNGDGHCQNQPYKCERLGIDSPGYRCDCRHPFYGDNCEYGYCDRFGTGQPTALSQLCHGASTCHNELQAPYYSCECELGLTGDRCDRDICDEGDKCNGHGQCIPAANALGYTCDCTIGYFGDTCRETACDAAHFHGHCLNGGQCMMDAHNLVNGYRCDCMPPFRGNYCGIHYGCDSNYAVCMNDGFCERTLEAPYFRCHCYEGFHGSYCQTHFCDTSDYRDAVAGGLGCGASGRCGRVDEPSDDIVAAYHAATYPGIFHNYIEYSFAIGSVIRIDAAYDDALAVPGSTAFNQKEMQVCDLIKQATTNRVTDISVCQVSTFEPFESSTGRRKRTTHGAIIDAHYAVIATLTVQEVIKAEYIWQTAVAESEVLQLAGIRPKGQAFAYSMEQFPGTTIVDGLIDTADGNTHYHSIADEPDHDGETIDEDNDQDHDEDHEDDDNRSLGDDEYVTIDQDYYAEGSGDMDYGDSLIGNIINGKRKKRDLDDTTLLEHSHDCTAILGDADHVDLIDESTGSVFGTFEIANIDCSNLESILLINQQHNCTWHNATHVETNLSDSSSAVVSLSVVTCESIPVEPPNLMNYPHTCHWFNSTHVTAFDDTIQQNGILAVNPQTVNCLVVPLMPGWIMEVDGPQQTTDTDNPADAQQAAANSALAGAPNLITPNSNNGAIIPGATIPGGTPVVGTGSSSNGANEYICLCAEGWAKVNTTSRTCEVSVCDIEVDGVGPNPCGDRGDCLPRYSKPGYVCECKGGYMHGDASQCENHVCNMDQHPCGLGTCNIDATTKGYTCDCTGESARGWSGPNCEFHVCESATAPCKNGGVCVPSTSSVLGHACRCPNAISEEIGTCDLSSAMRQNVDLLHSMTNIASGRSTSGLSDAGIETIAMETTLSGMLAGRSADSRQCHKSNVVYGREYTVNGRSMKPVCSPPSGYSMQRGAYYLTLKTGTGGFAGLTRENAERVCRQGGGYLASIASIKERDSIKGDYWIGLKSNNVHMSYLKFDDGCQVAPYKVSNRDSECYALVNGNVENVMCDRKFGVLCKIIVDSAQACPGAKGSNPEVCRPSNVYTDGSTDRSKVLQGKMTISMPAGMKNGPETFTVNVSGDSDVTVTTLQEYRQSSPCEAVGDGSFTCKSNNVISIEVQSIPTKGVSISEVEVLGCSE